MGEPGVDFLSQKKVHPQRRQGWLVAAAAGAVLLAAVAAVPALSEAGREVLQSADATPEPSPAAESSEPDWVTNGATTARVCRHRFGRCLAVDQRERLDDLTERFNAAEPARIGCGGGEPDIVVLRFAYADSHEERVSVNLDCDDGTASVADRKGRALDAGLRAAIVDAGPTDYGDPATLAEAFGPAPAYPGRPWQKDGVDVESSELAAAGLPSHCDWQAATFVGGSAFDRRQFIRDPDGALDFRPELQQGFRSGRPLPSDAARTGYTSGRFALWVAPSDPEAVWLSNTTDDSDTERWPSPVEHIACA